MGQDYLVRTVGIMNFSKSFQNSQNNLKNYFKELQRFLENFKKSKNTYKKQFLKISKAFRKLPDISDDFRRHRHLPEVKKVI